MLREAAWRTQKAVLDYYVTKHAINEITDDIGNSVLHFAVDGPSSPETLEHILCHKSLDPEVDIVNMQNEFGDTALHVASENAELDCVSVLLRCGADINIYNDLGDTALQVAVESRNLGVVQRLVEHDEVDVLATDFSGKTADERTNDQMIKELIQKMQHERNTDNYKCPCEICTNSE